MSSERKLLVADLGRSDYLPSLELQRQLCRARIEGRLQHDLLLLVEHPEVITLGRGTRPSSLPLEPSRLVSLGYQVHQVERGGDVTYHGPGQLVGYPILNLANHRLDLHWYLRQLEQALITALHSFGIAGRRRQGLTGVWIEDRKVASIGVHVKRWVTFHGFALNVSTSLERFDAIVPCGISDVTMTSIAAELGATDDGSIWHDASRNVVAAMETVFELRAEATKREGLQRLADSVTPR